MPDLCNLDGVIQPETEARIPVLDRGFLFGDSIYEVMRTEAGSPFAWPEHLERLRVSADGLRMQLDLDDATVMRRVVDTIRAAGHAESYVRIVVSRGSGTAPNIDFAYAPGPPTWVILVRDLPPRSDRPVQLAFVQRLRNDRRALDPAVKSGNYLNNVLGLAEARSLGATDCLFANAAGFVTEASTSNVFVWSGGRLATPPLTAGILAGVTRGHLIAFCRQRGMQVDERDLLPDEVRAADDVFLTSTLRDLSPVTHLDGRPLHGGGPGRFATELGRDFSAHLRSFAHSRYRPELLRLLGDR
jgi:branched-chain amino acid aminotransferase